MPRALYSVKWASGRGAGDVGFASFGGLFEGGRDVEAQQCADVVVVHLAAQLGCCGEDDVDALAHLLEGWLRIPASRRPSGLRAGRLPCYDLPPTGA